ncbi:MAG: hypothetical protein OEV00_10400, partial [Acidobacteriota bacterium]|nr:hypothetical protein [Acidobacteriota bacterium]
MDRVNQRLQRSAWLTRTVWMVVLLLATAPMALAQSDSSNRDMATDNVLVTVRIGKMENAKRIPIKSFELIVAPGTPGSKLLSGQRVPIPTGGADGAITYQNIGFVANVAAWLVDKDAIRIVADIE